jgi:2-dehydro-3-deoxy-D-arabinonate dehydratase
MQIAKIRSDSMDTVDNIAIVEGDRVRPLMISDGIQTLTQLLELPDPVAALAALPPNGPRLPLSSVELLPPIEKQEVWAAGVTYRRSKVARMNESATAAVFYDKIYEARRPELFFKANPHRVVGPDAMVRIRADSKWNVPEPELALVLNSRMQLVGFTIGNDMSSRDIEGENPLYLPQAKIYDASCALGPWITLASAMPSIDNVVIRLNIDRNQKRVFEGETKVSQMTRSFTDLIHWLSRDNTFPQGAILLTGTGIIPEDNFTLQSGDTIEIGIDGIGILKNRVA